MTATLIAALREIDEKAPHADNCESRFCKECGWMKSYDIHAGHGITPHDFDPLDCDCVKRIARDALAEWERTGGWLPIETAPKDGSRIMILDGVYPYFAQWLEDAAFGCGNRGPGWQIFSCEDDDWYAVAVKDSALKGWQPLPRGPQDETARP